MPTPNNSIEIFDKGEIFPSTSANNVKTTQLDFYSNKELFPYLLQPQIQSQEAPQAPSPVVKRRIFIID